MISTKIESACVKEGFCLEDTDCEERVTGDVVKKI
jgi:hypothetical protein